MSGGRGEPREVPRPIGPGRPHPWFQAHQAESTLLSTRFLERPRRRRCLGRRGAEGHRQGREEVHAADGQAEQAAAHLPARAHEPGRGRHHREEDGFLFFFS